MRQSAGQIRPIGTSSSPSAPADPGQRSVWATYPLSSSSKAALFAQADRVSNDDLVAMLTQLLGLTGMGFARLGPRILSLNSGLLKDRNVSVRPFPERLRFAEFTLDRLPNGRCRARVGLTWRDSEQFTGEGEGLASQAGELRCSAQACVVALGQAVQGGPELRAPGREGGSCVRRHRGDRLARRARRRQRTRVVGSYLTEADTPRGAALAVLNATNRILGNRLFMR